MKRFMMNYKLQVLAVGVLALAQVTAFVPYQGYQRDIARDELATGNNSGGGTAIALPSEGVSKNRESQILDAYKKYQEKAKECLIRVRDEDALKSLFRNFRLDSSDENLLALDNKLVDMGLLSSDSSSSSSSASDFRSKLLSLESDDDTSTSSSSAILDPDKKSDLKEIAKCHERRIQDLDSKEEKRAYFKKIESKFADMLAESDSKEISTLAKEFQKTAKAADPNNALGLQTQTQMHIDYATILAQGMTQIQLLEKQLAMNPNDQLVRSQLELAKSSLNTNFMNVQTRYMQQINPQASNALEQMTAMQSITQHWTNQKNSSLSGSTGTSFANTVNSSGLVGDPLVNNLNTNNGLLSGISTLPSTTNMLTIPQIVTVPSTNLATVRTNNGRLNISPESLSYFANPQNRIANTARNVPALGSAGPQ